MSRGSFSSLVEHPLLLLAVVFHCLSVLAGSVVLPVPLYLSLQLFPSPSVLFVCLPSLKFRSTYRLPIPGQAGSFIQKNLLGYSQEIVARDIWLCGTVLQGK